MDGVTGEDDDAHVDPLVHFARWVQPPEVHAACEPEKHGLHVAPLPMGVFRAMNGLIYTFNTRRVTCQTCLERL